MKEGVREELGERRKGEEPLMRRLKERRWEDCGFASETGGVDGSGNASVWGRQGRDAERELGVPKGWT